jgi:hypothetical protein
MSDTSVIESAPENTHRRRRPNFFGWFKSPRSIALAALVIALIAAAASIAAWLRPAHEGASTSFSSQQSAQAKKNVCSAYITVRRAVSEKTPNPRPDDPVAKLEAATNRQLVLLGGGAFLDKTVTAEPAAPADLAKAVSSVAGTLEHLAVNNLARVNNQLQTVLWKDFGSEAAQVNKLCK